MKDLPMRLAGVVAEDLPAQWQFPAAQLLVEAVAAAWVWMCCAPRTGLRTLPEPLTSKPATPTVGGLLLAAGTALALVNEFAHGSPWFLLTPCTLMAVSGAWRLAVATDGTPHADAALGTMMGLLSLVSMPHVVVAVVEQAESCSGRVVGPCEAADMLNLATELVVHVGLGVAAWELMAWRPLSPGAVSTAVWVGWEWIVYAHATTLVLVSYVSGLNVGFVTSLPSLGTSAMTAYGPLAKPYCAVFISGLFVIVAWLFSGGSCQRPTWLHVASSVTVVVVATFTIAFSFWVSNK